MDMDQKKGIIVSGGSLEEDFALAFFAEREGSQAGTSPDRGLIAADAGLVFCRRHGLVPGWIVGDFDSAQPSCLEEYRARGDIEIRTFPPEKDWTDTELAVRLGLELGWKQIFLLGGTGTRLDHMLGNLQVMEMALAQGVSLVLLDSHNRVRMCRNELRLKRERTTAWDLSSFWGDYLSLIPWGGPAEGLTLKGFRYPLDDACLETGKSLGISNEITGEEAVLSLRKGILIAAESRD